MKKIARLVGVGIIFLLLSAGTVFAAEITISDVELGGNSVTSGGQKFFTGDVQVSFKAASDAGITQVSLILEGKNAGSADFGSETAAAGSITVEKSFLEANEPSDHKFSGTLTAKDAEGTTRDYDIEFYADVTDPSVSLSGASDGGIYNKKVTVKVRMSDKQLSGADAQIVIKKDGSQIEKKTGAEDCSDYSKELSDEGVYEISASVTDRGGHSAEKTIVFTIDKTAPTVSDITVSGDAEGSWYRADVTSKATSSDALSGIESVKVYVDGKLLNTFTSAGEHIYQIIKSWIRSNDTANGRHIIRYIAEDRAGNTAEKETSIFADVEAPTLSYSGVKDGDFVNESPKVTAQASDNHLDQTTVYMDVYKNGEKMESKSGSEACSFKPEDDGVYRLSSYAEDAAKNRSDTEEITFTLDRKAPQLDMHKFEGHKKDGFTWFDTSITSETDAEDELSGLASIELYVNGKLVKSESPEGNLTAVIERTLDKSWITENESEDGGYLFRVVAKDRAGNEISQEKKAYADVKSPSVSLSGIDAGTHTRKTPRIDVKVTDNYAPKNTIHIKITRDGKTVHRFERAGESTYTKAFKKDGNYVVSVYAVDKAGNTSKVKKLSFVKDTVAPALALTGAKKGEYYSSARTISAHVKERNYKTVKVTSSMKMVVDGKTSTPSFGKIVPNSRNYVQKKKLTKTGTYTITLRAVDKAGNKSKPVSLTFTVDTIKPEITITGADGIKGYSAVCAPKTKVTDSYYDTSKVTLTRVSGKSPAGLSYKDGKLKDGGTRSYANFRKAKEYDDVYTLTVTARDKAGNTSRFSKTFTVCRFGSRFTVAQKELNGAYLQNVDTDITIAERTPASLKEREGLLIRDGRQQDDVIKTSEAKLDGWNRYFYTFPKEYFADEGVYTLDTRSLDSAGNTSKFTESKNFTLYVDKTAPVISFTGVTPDSQYKLSEAKGKISISDNIKASSYIVKSNGKTIYVSEGKNYKPEATVQLPAGLNQKISITAKDAAGNVGEYELDGVTVSDNLFMRLFANRTFDIGFGLGLAALAALLIFLAKRHKKDEEVEA